MPRAPTRGPEHRPTQARQSPSRLTHPNPPSDAPRPACPALDAGTRGPEHQPTSPSDAPRPSFPRSPRESRSLQHTHPIPLRCPRSDAGPEHRPTQVGPASGRGASEGGWLDAGPRAPTNPSSTKSLSPQPNQPQDLPHRGRCREATEGAPHQSPTVNPTTHQTPNRTPVHIP